MDKIGRIKQLLAAYESTEDCGDRAWLLADNADLVLEGLRHILVATEENARIAGLALLPLSNDERHALFSGYLPMIFVQGQRVIPRHGDALRTPITYSRQERAVAYAKHACAKQQGEIWYVVDLATGDMVEQSK